MKTTKIITMAFCLCLGLTASAQDTKSQFNPIEHAVISQTIAPDARSAGMGDVGVATDPDVNSQSVLHQSCGYCPELHPVVAPIGE